MYDARREAGLELEEIKVESKESTEDKLYRWVPLPSHTGVWRKN